MMRTTLLTGALLGLMLAGLSGMPTTAGEKGGTEKLFNGKDLSGWRVFLAPGKKADPAKIFSVKDGEIYCEGSVFGYLITEKDYGDYKLKVQWRWGKKGKAKLRNSGVFVHVSGPDMIWPKGAEAQLMEGHAGDFWLVDNFKLNVDPKRQDPKTPRHFYRMKDDVEKKPGEWNQYVITCKGGSVRLEINGQLVNEGNHAGATSGKILLQSEGAEIYFRNVELEHLK